MKLKTEIFKRSETRKKRRSYLLYSVILLVFVSIVHLVLHRSHTQADKLSQYSGSSGNPATGSERMSETFDELVSTENGPKGGVSFGVENGMGYDGTNEESVVNTKDADIQVELVSSQQRALVFSDSLNMYNAHQALREEPVSSPDSIENKQALSIMVQKAFKRRH